MQTITYRGQTVAAATVHGLFLCRRLASRPVGDPERTFVIFMGVYAADVLRGELNGPYSDEQARRYARVALIPGELLEHDLPCLEETARALHVPVGELRQARAQYGSMQRALAAYPGLGFVAVAGAELAGAGRGLGEQVKGVAVGVKRPAVPAHVRAADDLKPVAAQMAAHAAVLVIDQLADRRVVGGAV